MAKYKYRCKFCEAGFVNEDRYLKHRCKEMERDEQMRTPEGLAAWEHYKTWLTLQRRQPPTVQTFLSSKYYTSFYKFAVFAKKVGIPNTEQYIRRMIRHKVNPTIWTSDEIYTEYLKYLDTGKDPYIQVKHTVDFLFKAAKILECNVDDIFDHLEPDEVIQMLRRRQISPWILIHSPKFKAFVEKMSVDQKMVFKTVVKPDVWVQRRRDNPEVASKMKEIVRELNL